MVRFRGVISAAIESNDAFAFTHRLIASVPASRTTALKSAPTYPCARPARARRSACDMEWGVLASRTSKIAKRASASGTPDIAQKQKKKYINFNVHMMLRICLWLTYLELSVESSWPSKSGVDCIRPIRGSYNHDSFDGATGGFILHSVHYCQQRRDHPLFNLSTGALLAPWDQCVNLIQNDDTRAFGTRISKHFSKSRFSLSMICRG